MAFVITSGQLARIDPAGNTYSRWGYPSALPTHVEMSHNQWMTYEAIWKAQPALRTVISFLARNVAQLGIDPYRRKGDNDREKLRDHPLSRLLEDPFPGSKWTKYRLMAWTVSEYCIYDCAYWLKGRADDGQPTLIPVPRRYIEPIGESPFFPEFYRITGTKGYRDLDPEQVVHFFGYNPEDPRQGVSPIETLRQILAEEFAANSFREKMWRNGAWVGGVITRPEKAPRWSDEARMRFRTDWRAQYSADGADAGGTPVLEDGMTYQTTGITAQEAQYIEARKLTREEVAVQYHVNPAMLGLMDKTSGADMPEIHKMLYADTLGPMLTAFAQDIERQVLPDLSPNRDVYVEFNLAEKLRGSFEEQAAAISSSVGGPWMTRSEARARHNLPHLTEADELITPLNVTAGGLASPRDTAPDDAHNEESNGKPPQARPAQTVKPKPRREVTR